MHLKYAEYGGHGQENYRLQAEGDVSRGGQDTGQGGRRGKTGAGFMAEIEAALDKSDDLAESAIRKLYKLATEEK